MLESIKSVFYNLDKVKRNGFIMIPSIEGFEVYEIEEVHLKSLLAIEAIRKKNNLQTHSIPKLSEPPFFFGGSGISCGNYYPDNKQTNMLCINCGQPKHVH